MENNAGSKTTQSTKNVWGYGAKVESYWVQYDKFNNWTDWNDFPYTNISEIPRFRRIFINLPK